MKGSAPGNASSVKPNLAFGALATSESGSGYAISEGESDILADTVRMDVGEAAHVQAGECIGSEDTSRIAGPWLGGGMGSFSRPLFRQDSISSSLIGDTPRCLKGVRP